LAETYKTRYNLQIQAEKGPIKETVKGRKPETEKKGALLQIQPPRSHSIFPSLKQI